MGSSVRLYGVDSVVVRVKTPSEAFSMTNRPVPSVQTFSRLRYGTSAGTSVVRARRVHGAASHGGPSAAGEVTLVPLPLPIPVPLPRARAAPSAQPATRSGPLGSPAPALEPLSGPQPGRAATTTAMGTTSERARPLLIRPVRPCRRPGVRLSGSCRAHARRLLARTISRVGTTTVAGGDSSPTSRAKICCAASEPLAIGSWWIAVIGGSTSPAYSMSS